jgi:GTPase
MSHSARSNRERPLLKAQEAVLIAVQRPDGSDCETQRSLDELSHLVSRFGVRVIASVVQKRDRVAPSYLGEGKLREVAALTGGSGEISRGPEAHKSNQPARTDLVVVADDELGAGQVRQLETALDVTVLDRTNVILHVFELGARTREAKLEIELARLHYELPRIRDDRSLGDREGGGGRAARGHTNVELAKQRARERMAAIRRELEHARRKMDRQREARSDVQRVALVGYTNAGKSSVMRLLTGSDVLVEDRLFATLGTTVRPLAPPTGSPVLVADTVGFIERLPHALLASFQATLAEASDCDLLLHVVDASDSAFRSQLRLTEQVLREVGVDRAPTWLVLNKIDRLPAADRETLAREFPNALQTCALRSDSGEDLRRRITSFFDQALDEATFHIPYTKQGLLAMLRSRAQILHEDYGESIIVTLRGSPGALAWAEKLIGQERLR